MRKTHSKSFKFKVALEAIRGDMTLAQILSKYQVAGNLVHRWKRQLLEQGKEVFSSPKEGDGSRSRIYYRPCHRDEGDLVGKVEALYQAYPMF